MKKFVVLVCALLVIGNFVGCSKKETASSTSAPQSSQQAPKMTIRYADVQAENDTETMAARKFAELVNQKSGGRITVEVYPNGQLGDLNYLLEAVQMGAIEICRNNPGWLADAGAAKMNVLSLPFIFKDLDQANRVLESKIGKDMLDEIQSAGLKMIGLGYYEPQLRSFFFRDKKVTKLSDMAGMKLRVPTTEINTSMVRALGANPTPINYNELYSSLQTGIVDGAENPLKGFINMKFGEVCKNFTFTGHQYEASIVLISEIFWNKLSSDDQKLFREAMAETSKYFSELSKELQAKLIAEGESIGVTFSNVDNIEEWQNAVKPLYQQYGAAYADLIAEIQSM